MPKTKQRNLWERFTNEPQFLPKQREFIESERPYTAYIGGMGSGKSVVLVAKSLYEAFRYPGNIGLIGRKWSTDLKDTTYRTFQEFCPEWAVRKEYIQEKRVVLINGSQILFRGLDDFPKLKSFNGGFVAIDEMNENPIDCFEFFITRIRHQAVPNGKQKIFATANCEGHDWMWKLWVRDSKPEFKLLHAPTEENIFLPQEYIKRMRSTLPEDMQRRYLDADFNVQGGLVYPEFDRAVHMVDNMDFKIPESWNRGRVIDHGLRNPEVCLWYAVSPEGIIYIYREYYETNRTVEQNVNHILALSLGERYRLYTYIDPACSQTSSITGQPLLEEYRENGLDVLPAPRDPTNTGINRVRQYLKVDERLINPITGQPGSPRLLIERGCRSTLNEFDSYMWRAIRPSYMRNAPEKVEKKDDHAMDAIRYMVLTRPDLTTDHLPPHWAWGTSERSKRAVDPNLGDCY